MADLGSSPYSANSYNVLSPSSMKEATADQRSNNSKSIVLACGPSFSPLEDITDVREYFGLNSGGSSPVKTSGRKDDGSPPLSFLSGPTRTESEIEGGAAGEIIKLTRRASLDDIVENCMSVGVQLAESLSIQDLSSLLELIDRRTVLSAQGAMDLADMGCKSGRVKREDQLRLNAALTGGAKKCDACSLHKFLLLTRQSLRSYRATF